MATMPMCSRSGAAFRKVFATMAMRGLRCLQSMKAVQSMQMAERRHCQQLRLAGCICKLIVFNAQFSSTCLHGAMQCVSATLDSLPLLPQLCHQKHHRGTLKNCQHMIQVQKHAQMLQEPIVSKQPCTYKFTSTSE